MGENLRNKQTVLKFVVKRIPASSDVQNLCPPTFPILFSSQLSSQLLENCPFRRTQIPFLGLGRDTAGLWSKKTGKYGNWQRGGNVRKFWKLREDLVERQKERFAVRQGQDACKSSNITAVD